MPKVDQFESVFKSATKTSFHYQRIRISEILVVTDLSEEDAGEFCSRAKGFLRVLEADSPQWRTVTATDFDDVRQLLELVELAPTTFRERWHEARRTV